MFTGIVTAIGIVQRIRVHAHGMQMTIAAADYGKDIHLGNSISVNGCCLTVTQRTSDNFDVDVGLQTLTSTCMADMTVGTRVNLEKALTLQQLLGGHLVTGHVDGVANIVALEEEGLSQLLTLEVPEAFARYIALKGSIALNGVSLTVQSVERNRFTIMLIPFTRNHTVLTNLHVGMRLNFEVDILARYLERLVHYTPNAIRKEESVKE
ncbi:MAG: riboflavin synthase [Pseudomonadota bacterium]